MATSSASTDRPLADTNVSAESQARIDWFQKYTLGTYIRPALILSHGKGCWLYDTDGRKFLDFNAGIAVNALGHGDSQVAELVSDQASKLIHTSNLYHNEWAGRLAEALIETTKQLEEARVGPGETGFIPGKVFFTNSGTEANEGALKFAKKYGNLQAQAQPNRYPNGKYEVVAFSRGFHGRSMGALSATAAPKYQKPFFPLVPGFVHCEYNDVEAVRRLIRDETCAVILEPVQGEGGVFQATPEFLQAVRERCDQVGALLIYDEIQCGIGRTGKLWGFQNFPASCRPDILCMAKPLANGVPIGAVMMTDAVAALINAGDHGTTFGGNPLACRVGLHVFQRIAQPAFLSHVLTTGQYLQDALRAKVATKHPTIIKEIRGLGLMVGMEFTVDPAPLVKIAREVGILIITAGSNTVRLVPPLTLSNAEVDTAVDILGVALDQFVASLNACKSG
ncbi:acetylornithine aminotransferase [Dimargaris verticillata]|uniref:acetylornithine transaminase n=1 Tax=Dimargaris verticillata TaxID=2761393 RepID=A0A9W8EDH3_9FUNG|nr:acetylornithine aminotransferase [Dimargaris verticillata]